ncbi:hypothetical protein TNCV_3392201 [Trichonephila clavipes]|nr:hypothetical protein TNCV_3392201 [Trichonephila clavipes]
MLLRPRIKITDSWSACRELEPSPTEDPPCRAVSKRWSGRTSLVSGYGHEYVAGVLRVLDLLLLNIHRVEEAVVR